MVGMMSKNYSFEEFCRLLFNNGYAIERSFELASFPGLLAPAFVACSTNAGEGLVKLSHVV